VRGRSPVERCPGRAQGCTLAVETTQSLVRYTCHLLDMFAQVNDVVWEVPDGFVMRTDILCEAAVHAMAIIHHAIILVRSAESAGGR